MVVNFVKRNNTCHMGGGGTTMGGISVASTGTCPHSNHVTSSK